MREGLLLAGRIVDLPMTLFVIRFRKRFIHCAEPPFWVIIGLGNKWLSPVTLLWNGRLGSLELSHGERDDPIRLGPSLLATLLCG